MKVDIDDIKSNFFIALANFNQNSTFVDYFTKTILLQLQNPIETRKYLYASCLKIKPMTES